MPHNGVCMINICSELKLHCLCVQLGEIAILIFLLTTHKTHLHIFTGDMFAEVWSCLCKETKQLWTAVKA